MFLALVTSIEMGNSGKSMAERLLLLRYADILMKPI